MSFCFLFFAAALSAQAPTPIYIGDDAPPWMHMMQAEQPDVFAIQKAYKDWFAARPFEKNSYTNYYKRWMRWARPFAQADGSLHLPDPAQDAAKEKKVQAQRAASSALAARRRQKSDWTFVGPKQTYHTDGQTVVTWQTNIYCFDISTYNPGILYAGGESGGMWKTTDKGMNWTLLTTDVLHDAFNALIIHPDNPNIVFAGTRGKIIKTADGGATWTTVYSAGNLRVNEFAFCSVTGSGEIFLAATSAGILRTVNGGNTWSQTSANETWTIKTKTGDLSTVFAIRKNGSSADFLRSTNGGNTWTAFNGGLYAPQNGEAGEGAIIPDCPPQPGPVVSHFFGHGPQIGRLHRRFQKHRRRQ